MKRIVVFFLFFVSCSSVKNLPPCYQTIKEDIRAGNWKYDDIKHYYVTNDEFKKKLNSSYQDCIKSLKEQNILDLFGKPTETRENKTSVEKFRYSLYYLMTPPCKNTDIGIICWYLIIFLDTNNTVSGINLFGTEGGL